MREYGTFVRLTACFHLYCNYGFAFYVIDVGGNALEVGAFTSFKIYNWKISMENYYSNLRVSLSFLLAGSVAHNQQSAWSSTKDRNIQEKRSSSHGRISFFKNEQQQQQQQRQTNTKLSIHLSNIYFQIGLISPSPFNIYTSYLPQKSGRSVNAQQQCSIFHAGCTNCVPNVPTCGEIGVDKLM